MSGAHFRQAVDRTLVVEPSELVCTGYVRVERVRLECRDRMAVGDLDQAYRTYLQLGGGSLHPSPWGYWERDREDGARQFVLVDGRHSYIAQLLLGRSHIFVSWLSGTEEEEEVQA